MGRELMDVGVRCWPRTGGTTLVWWLQSSDAIRWRMHPSWIAPLAGPQATGLPA